MLSDEGKRGLGQVEDLIALVWGDGVQIEHKEILSAPFDLFELRAIIHDKYEVLISYDRSIVGVNIKIDGTYINLRNLTKRDLIKGFDSSTKEGMLYNFRVLEETLKLLE